MWIGGRQPAARRVGMTSSHAVLFLGLFLQLAPVAPALTMQEVAECRGQADLFLVEMNGFVLVELLVFAYAIVFMHVLIDEWYVPALELVTSNGMLNLPRPLIGVTIMAAGNCLPELSMSVIALLFSGNQDIGTGEVFGSCVFDLLAILGVVCVSLPPDTTQVLTPHLMLYYVVWAAAATAADMSLFYANVETTWPASITMVAAYVAFVVGVFVFHRLFWGFAHFGELPSASKPPYVPPEDAKSPGAGLLTTYGSAAPVADEAALALPAAPAGGALSCTAVTVAATSSALERSPASGASGAVQSRDALLQLPPPARESTPLLMAPPPAAAGEGAVAGGTAGKGFGGAPAMAAEVGAGAAPTTDPLQPDGMLSRALDVVAMPPRWLFRLTIPHAHEPIACLGGRRPWALTLSLCIAYTLILSYSMVAVASRAICLLGVRKNSLGATVLCLSAGFPDLLTAMILVKRPGMIGMAASNPFGALLFNGFIALGLPWLILGTYADVFPPAKGTWYPSLVGFLCIAAALLGILLNGLRLTRGLGVGLLTLYMAYLVVVIYDGTTRPARPPA